MIRWFGKSWGAAVCEPDQHTETPVGIACMRCRVAIEPRDRGFALQCADVNDQGELVVSTVVEHLRCFINGLVCPGCENCRPKTAAPTAPALDGRLN